MYSDLSLALHKFCRNNQNRMCISLKSIENMPIVLPVIRGNVRLFPGSAVTSGGSVVGSCDSPWFFMLLSAAALLSQDGEATDCLRFPTTVVQWLSTLFCSEDTAMWFQFILCDMLLVCWQVEVPLESVYHQTCLYFLLHTSIFSSTLTNNSLPSPVFPHNTISRVAFCWRVIYSWKCEWESKVPAVHSFPRHCCKLLAPRPALIFRPW